MTDAQNLLGETVRVWDAQHGGVLAEGMVIAWTDRPTITIRVNCECGREALRSHIADLPIEVRTWVPR